MIRTAQGIAVLLAATQALAQEPPALEPARQPPADSAASASTPAPPPPVLPPAFPAPPPPAAPPWYPPLPPTGQYPWYPPPQAQGPWYPPPPAVSVPEAPAAPPAETAVAEPEPPPSTGPGPSRASWSLQLESAQGVATGKFQNTLLAGHVDYAFASRMSLGGYLAVANLKGKDRRTSALLPCALVTYEKPPGPGHSVSFPIQFATGYLARNGPVARLAAGLAWAVGQRTDLVFVLATMAWVTRDQMLLSVNTAVELRFRTK